MNLLILAERSQCDAVMLLLDYLKRNQINISETYVSDRDEAIRELSERNYNAILLTTKNVPSRDSDGDSGYENALSVMRRAKAVGADIVLSPELSDIVARDYALSRADNVVYLAPRADAVTRQVRAICELAAMN